MAQALEHQWIERARAPSNLGTPAAPSSHQLLLTPKRLLALRGGLADPQPGGGGNGPSSMPTVPAMSPFRLLPLRAPKRADEWPQARAV